MQLTKQQLKKIIKEEIENTLKEMKDWKKEKDQERPFVSQDDIDALLASVDDEAAKRRERYDREEREHRNPTLRAKRDKREKAEPEWYTNV